MRSSTLLGKLKLIPISLALLVLIVSLFGIVILYSAGGMNMEPWAWKQTIHLIEFSLVALIIILIDPQIIHRYAYVIYIVVVISLIMVELFGYTAMGATRWIQLGPVRLQPSEVMKIAIVLMLARYYSDNTSKNINKLVYLLPPILAVLFPAALIIKQPDLGTGVMTLLVAATIFFLVGVSIYKFALVGLAGISVLPVIWTHLHDYQKKRILIFLNPEQDKLGAGYNIIQSKIAIGSGGLWGKGIGHGTQSHLDFLPEHQTDFIFATLAEEIGFAGCAALLLVYVLIIVRCSAIAIESRSIFGKLLVLGITSIFFWHVFINIAMVTGMVPVVGVPLPLISYGGTMMGSVIIGFGLIINIYVNKNRFKK